MTEIPEHLLKRAAARRAAMTGGEAPAEAGAEAAATPGESVAPAAAPAAPAAKKQAPLPTLDPEPAARVPDSPVVAAARNRKRVPFWAAPVLALLPLWAFIYVYAVQPPPAGENDPLVIGKEVYASAGCQGCHGAAGEGGAGQKLSEGEVIQTFEDPLTLVHWLAYGAAEGARDDGTYGDLDRPGGPRNISTLAGQMPAFGTSLSPEELAAVTMYIRAEFGADLYDPEAEQGFTPEAFEADVAAIDEQVA
ncbi:MAG TPA: c-type cytochrome, partial [Aquihabitans sp.]|nr:c-type cytochrome [Aquihabitans sp.]